VNSPPLPRDLADGGSIEFTALGTPVVLRLRALRRKVRWYATALAVILVALGVWLRHSIHWGDLPTWILAVTTLLAFLSAAFAGVVAYELLKVEIARDVKAAEDRRHEWEQRKRAQAAEVFTWADEEPFEDNPRDIRLAAFVRNASSRPVYDVRIGWARTTATSVPFLMPGADHVVPGAGTSISEGTYAEFRDSAGLRWRTTSHGELTELPPGTPPAGTSRDDQEKA
jgi:hypothetical protein